MLVRLLDEVEGLVTLIQSVLDERAEHAVLLVDPVEEPADVALLGESAFANLQRTVVRLHTSPPCRRRIGLSRHDLRRDPGGAGTF
jgi:hypothetical protein